MKINQNSFQMWRFMLVFPELGKQRQEDCQEFEASLVKSLKQKGKIQSFTFKRFTVLTLYVFNKKLPLHTFWT